MSFEAREKIRLSTGREVWRVNYVRYRDVVSGKFISNEKISKDPALREITQPNLNEVEDQMLLMLIEIVTQSELTAKSISSIKMLLEMVDRIRERATTGEQDWFILGRETAKMVLALLEEDQT